MMESVHCDEADDILDDGSDLISESRVVTDYFEGQGHDEIDSVFLSLGYRETSSIEESGTDEGDVSDVFRETPSAFWSTTDFSLAGFGSAVTLIAGGRGRFDSVKQATREIFSGVDASEFESGARFIGGFSFHDGNRKNDHWDEFPGALFFLPSVELTREGSDIRLRVNAYGNDVGRDDLTNKIDELSEEIREYASELDFPEISVPGVRNLERTPSSPRWRKQVENALRRIERGDLTKVVLAQSLSTTLEKPLDLSAQMRNLGRVYPDCYRYVFKPSQNHVFFGATPERLVTLRDSRVETEALAGSTGRGETKDEDDWLASQLEESEKDIHEHEVVVEAIREQLEPFVESVETGEREVQRLHNVQHLRTPITASLDSESTHILSLVEALHPTPAVGGLPPEEALRTIRETEEFDRGWYAAPLGWFDARGNGSFAVGIRSAVASMGRSNDETRDTVTMLAGAGIVKDSEPEKEWDEVQLKYKPILDQLEDD